MAWLPNPFKSLGDSDFDESLSDTEPLSGGGSVKEDLSEIGETISRPLRGVAEFLAPPPRNSSSPPVRHGADEFSDGTRSPRLAGIRSDLAEISGSFKSLLSSKISSNFLRRKEEGSEAREDEDDRVAGITDEVVDFVSRISEGPECWKEFPLSVEDNDFTMNQAQVEHISNIEKIVPSLAELKIRLKSDMSERQFWMIYFILLVPRLDENSLNLLSTPEVIKGRNSLLTMLRNKRDDPPTPDSNKDHIDYPSDDKIDRKGHVEYNSSAEKIVLPENLVCYQVVQTSIKETAENISEGGAEVQKKDSSDAGSSSSDGSSDWVRLKKNEKSGQGQSRESQLSSRNRDSEGEESSDWLNIHESDYLS